MHFLIAGLSCLLAGGLGALLFSCSPRLATGAGAFGTVAGCVLGLVPALHVLLEGQPESWQLAWDAAHGSLALELDALSAFFLLPVLGLAGLAALYGADYLLSYRHEKSLGPPWFFFTLFVAGMVLVLLARTSLLFLMAWEMMSLSAFCLVIFEHEDSKVQRAGWVYLIAAHLGVAVIIALFLLLGYHANSWDFSAFARISDLGQGWAGLLFVLALIGFGTKAGFVPFHVWLPEAHPAAPSHVSALMSGVMVKMGIYGLLRVLTFLGPAEPWWGLLLIFIGFLTGIFGISLALHQRDLKRVLAYSSIENMGLIAMALGLGLWGMAHGITIVAVLGATGCLLHIWNHTVMKGLMFLAAGSVLHATGTKDIERLGGLMRRMPCSGTCMLLGALAIAALPPMNGFVSKWVMYLGFLKAGLSQGGTHGLAGLLATAGLALIGGLAAICFVRLSGLVLLGSPRSKEANQAREASVWLTGPILVLVMVCISLALFPGLLMEVLARPLSQVFGPILSQPAAFLDSSQVTLDSLGWINAAIGVATAVVAALLVVLLRRSTLVKEETWGCGYARPSERMQYTGRSFSEFVTEHLLPGSLRPRLVKQAPQGLFPASGSLTSESPDPIDQKVYEPLFERWARRCARLRFLQQGKLPVYLVYILLVVVLALAWVALGAWWERP
jgi:formate hydrogenlyase subunit 3/multisubunit Na+/H+ antiporter MnhD subunit